jgi:hypothetical protein
MMREFIYRLLSPFSFLLISTSPNQSKQKLTSKFPISSHLINFREDLEKFLHFSCSFCSLQMKKLLLIFGWILLISPLLAQNFPKEEIDLDSFIQDLFALQDDDSNYEDLYETLFMLYQNPVNLNRTTPEELRSLYVLSELQIDQFFKHVEKNGKLLTIYELQAIPEWDMRTIYNLMPFVTVRNAGLNIDSRSLFKRITSEENQFLMIRYQRTLQEREGYSRYQGNIEFPFTEYTDTIPNYYLGSPDKIYARYRISHTKDFSLGFTAEKDAGEQIVWNPDTKRYGADFLSAHAVFYNKGNFKTIAVGDYQIQFGQGLLMSAGFAVGKGSETVSTVRRSHTGIKPYSSVLETGFLRGGAATYEMGRFELTGFYSRLLEDASLDVGSGRDIEFSDLNPIAINRDLAFGSVGTFNDGDLLPNTPTGIGITGFHRTPSEIARKDRFIHQTSGGNLTYKSKDKSLLAGVTAVYNNFGVSIDRDSTNFNQFEFRGRSNLNLGLHYSYNWQNFNFFGEAARSSSGGLGMMAGLVSSLSRTVEFSLLYRNYQKDFHTFYGAAFGEFSRNINEKGLYMGIKIQPSRRWALSAFYDQFKSDWLRFRVNAPSSGNEYLVRLTHKPTRKITLYAQYRFENKARNADDPTGILDLVLPTKRSQYLLNADVKASKYISLKSRVQFSKFEDDELTRGFVALQDINLDLGRFKFSTRFAIFETDDFDNRQYVYEKNVLYAFSIPAYNGRGIRRYYLFRFKARRNLDFWFRYAITNFRDRDEIGTGLQAFEGNKIQEITAQVRYKF